MSTIFSKKQSEVAINSGIRFGVSSLRQGLAATLSRQMGELNPYDVARRSNNRITPQGVSKILKGESDVRLETLVTLAEALDMSPVALFIDALSAGGESGGKGDAAVQRDLELLTHFFMHVPRECQLDILASAEGIYRRRNRNSKISERHAARDAARASIAAAVPSDDRQSLGDTSVEPSAPAGEGGISYRKQRKPHRVSYDAGYEEEEKKKAS